MLNIKLSIFINILLWLINPFIQMKFFRSSKKDAFKMIQKLIKRIIKMSNIEIKVIGKAPKNHFLLAGNHQSNFDVFVLLAIIDEYFFITPKIELSKVAILKNIVNKIGFIFIDRNNFRSAFKVIDECVDRIKNKNENFLIFPEGTRSFKNELLEFKKSIFSIAKKSEMDINLFCIHNSFKAWEKNKWFSKKIVTLSFLDQKIKFDTINSKEDGQKKAFKLIKKELERLENEN